ncbi:MAG: ATP-binding protein [Planctomycetes bacterium]|nr:ATP-binding protein [Planctomycetota bacterium]MBM4078345.1 ATP-binding protein [Planctomycetota bacterium]
MTAKPSLIRRAADERELARLIRLFPVTAILGPRQCGKTTLARGLKADHFFDLENPKDAAKLVQPQLALEDLRGIIVIDEFQRLPELFPLLRHLVDTRPAQKYVILGSASRDLVRQSSETLAGRIGFFHLGGFRLDDVGSENLRTLWLRGGLPRSYLAPSHAESHLWRENYVATFLERDIPQLGISIPAPTLRRFWVMLSHYHGQTLNYSELARSFGISDMTVRRYVDVLAGTFMVRLLPPWHVNISKRLVKSPKLYLRDSGLFHCLMSIQTHEQLTSHSKLGASWEGFALDCVCRALGKRDEEFFFWGTHAGAELDLFWQHGGQNWGVEIKYADAPGLTKSMAVVMEDLNLAHLWVVYPGKDPYRLSERVTVLPLRDVAAWAADDAYATGRPKARG